MESPPLRLGRYALYGELASGGMATVHYGRMLGAAGFSKTVAIKRLHAQFAKDPDFASMFLDEARLAARIRHPNVVSTLDVVAVEGELFLVMEYVHGESLGGLVRLARDRGVPLPLPVIVAILAGVLHGLHAAHEATNEHGEPLHIVHRDVSPQNIVVGVDGIARVLDFGVAKASGRSHTTRDGRVKGKLAYMAPEQLMGQVTRASDIFAASVVLWQALTGKLLFHAGSEGETVARVLECKVQRPSELAPHVPPALDEITLRGLSREPRDRFATAREMARALERVVAPAPGSEVGELVETLAGATLTTRANHVASIESGTFSIEDGNGNTGSLPSLAESGTSSEQIVEPRTQLSSVSGSGAAPDTHRSRRRRLVGGVAVTAVASALLIAGGIQIAARREPAATLTSFAASASASAPPPRLPDVVVPEARGESSAAPPPSAPTSSSTPAPPRGATLQAPPRAPRPTPKSPSVNVNACNPPFTFDAQGIKHYKKECE